MTAEKVAPSRKRELLDSLGLHLVWASRVNPDSTSRIVLRRLFEQSDVLDLLEHLVNKERDE